MATEILDTVSYMYQLGATAKSMSVLTGINEEQILDFLPGKNVEDTGVKDFFENEQIVMHGALFAAFYTSALEKAIDPKAFLFAYFHYCQMMQGGEQRLNFNDGVRLTQELKKKNNCA